MDTETFLKSAPVEVLTLAATGAQDLNEMAHFELSQRGLNKKGEDIGVFAAGQEWKSHWG